VPRGKGRREGGKEGRKEERKKERKKGEASEGSMLNSSSSIHLLKTSDLSVALSPCMHAYKI
jgi:hypothetical protein